MKRFSVEAFKKNVNNPKTSLNLGWPQLCEGLTELEIFAKLGNGFEIIPEIWMRDNQALDILGYLKSGFHITTASATSLFSCYRLSERIREIEAMGYVVERKSLKTGKQGGQPTEYWLKND